MWSVTKILDLWSVTCTKQRAPSRCPAWPNASIVLSNSPSLMTYISKITKKSNETQSTSLPDGIDVWDRDTAEDCIPVEWDRCRGSEPRERGEAGELPGWERLREKPASLLASPQTLPADQSKPSPCRQWPRLHIPAEALPWCGST